MGAEVLAGLLVQADAMFGTDVRVRPAGALGRECPLLETEFADVLRRPFVREADDVAEDLRGPGLGDGELLDAVEVQEDRGEGLRTRAQGCGGKRQDRAPR